MDLLGIAQASAALLTPALPHLLGRASDKAVEAVGGELGKAAFEKARALWRRLSGPLGKQPGGLDAASEVARAPDDGDVVAAFRLHLRRLLEADPGLASELAHMLRDTQVAGIVVKAQGERSVAIGGSAGRATIVTGDTEGR